MSDETDKLLLGAGLAGLGYLAWKSHEKRKAFQEQLAQSLGACAIKLVYPDLGFLPDGRHVWHLTVEVPGGGAVTLRSPLLPGADPYGPDTVGDLVRRVGVWLSHAA